MLCTDEKIWHGFCLHAFVVSEIRKGKKKAKNLNKLSLFHLFLYFPTDKENSQNGNATQVKN